MLSDKVHAAGMELQDQHWWFTHDFLWDTNIVTAGICLAALAASGIALTVRTVQVTKAGRMW